MTWAVTYALLCCVWCRWDMSNNARINVWRMLFFSSISMFRKLFIVVTSILIDPIPAVISTLLLYVVICCHFMFSKKQKKWSTENTIHYSSTMVHSQLQPFIFVLQTNVTNLLFKSENKWQYALSIHVLACTFVAMIEKVFHSELLFNTHVLSTSRRRGKNARRILKQTQY